jgi:hypothetical protein
LAETEEVGKDGRGCCLQQRGDGTVASVADGERSELLEEASSEPFGSDRSAGELTGEQPAVAGVVVKRAALRGSGEFSGELVDRRGQCQAVSTQSDAGLVVVVVDVLDAQAGDTRERLAVEEDEESGDAGAQLEVVVVQELGDESPAVVVG